MTTYKLVKNAIAGPDGNVIEATGTPPMVRTPASNIVRLLNDAHELGARTMATTEKSDAVRATQQQRDGWREIAEVLIRIGFGWEMAGFGNVPPLELLAAVRAADPKIDATPSKDIDAREVADQEVIGRIRDGLIGRAWRVRGPKGYGTCDYPLCRHRGKGVPLRNVIVEVPSTNSPGVLEMRDPFRVCATQDNALVAECQRWGDWVAARARLGLIQVPK